MLIISGNLIKIHNSRLRELGYINKIKIHNSRLRVLG